MKLSHKELEIQSGQFGEVRKLALAQTLSKKNLDKNLYILADVKKEIKKTKIFY